MAIPTFTMRQLLEAGVHFGHHTRRWNPRMAPYIYGIRNNVHIIDLQQTVPMLRRAMQAVREVAANGGRVLFVGQLCSGRNKCRFPGLAGPLRHQFHGTRLLCCGKRNH